MSKEPETIDAVIDADFVAEHVAGIIYNQGKAKIFNVLESQLPCDSTTDNQKMSACKNITVDIIGSIARNAARFIRDTLGDWSQDVIAGGKLSDEDERAALKEYEEIKKVIR